MVELEGQKNIFFCTFFSRKPTKILIIQFHVFFQENYHDIYKNIITTSRKLSKTRENKKYIFLTPRQLRIYDRFAQKTSKKSLLRKKCAKKVILP